MHINVSCVLAELLAQTGYENGTPDCRVPAAAAARPAAARSTANLKTLHKPGVKEIFECVTHGLKASLTVLFSSPHALARPSGFEPMAACGLCVALGRRNFEKLVPPLERKRSVQVWVDVCNHGHLISRPLSSHRNQHKRLIGDRGTVGGRPVAADPPPNQS